MTSRDIGFFVKPKIFKIRNKCLTFSFVFHSDNLDTFFIKTEDYLSIQDEKENEIYSVSSYSQIQKTPISFILHNNKICTYINEKYFILTSENISSKLFLKVLDHPEHSDTKISEQNITSTSSNLNKLIGEGNFGCIFEIDDEIVSKIGFNDEILLEFLNIKCLPQPGPYYSFNDFIKITKLDKDDTKYVLDRCKYLKKRYENIIFMMNYDPDKHSSYEGSKYKLIKESGNISDITNNDLYELKLPYIKGVTLGNYLEDKEQILQIYNGKYYIGVRIFSSMNTLLSLLHCLIETYDFVKKLNEVHFIFHNDLNDGNIMYDEKERKMTIIDFEKMSIGEPLKEKSYDDQDIPFLEFHIRSVVYSCIFIKEMREILYSYGIIDSIYEISVERFNFYNIIDKLRSIIQDHLN